jgi:hypothetical protein
MKDEDIDYQREPTRGQSALYGMAKIVEQVASALPGDAARELTDGFKRKAREFDDILDQWVIQPQSTWAAQWNTISRTFRSYSDAALKDNWISAIAFRNDPSIDRHMQRRKDPVSTLDWEIESDDEDDKDQKEICKQVGQIVKQTPYFINIKNWLGEAIWGGRSAVQLMYTRKMIAGRRRVVVKKFIPISCDKVIWKWDGTPGILVYMPATVPANQYSKSLEQLADRGPCLFLYDRFDRMQYVIHTFQPSDSDYLYQGDFAAAIYGYGLRGRLYHCWWTRTELLSWVMNALQRLAINGMLIGFYDSGDDAAKAAVKQCLLNIKDFAFGLMPRRPGQVDPTSMIHNIPPQTVGYPVLKEWIDYFDTLAEEVILGRIDNYGVTGDAALELVTSAQFLRLKSDSSALDDTLTAQFLGPLLRMNEFVYRGRRYRGNELPFQIRYKSVLDTENVLKKLQSAQLLNGMGAQLDEKHLLRIAGFKRPEKPDDVLGYKAKQAELAMQAQAEQEAAQAQAAAQGGAGMEPGMEGPPAGAEGMAPAQNGPGMAPGPALSGSIAARPDTYTHEGEGAPPPRLERERYAASAYHAPITNRIARLLNGRGKETTNGHK